MRAWVEKGAILSKNARKKTQDLKKNQILKILIIRHAALGDMIQTRPFLIELRKCFPNSKLTLSLITNYQYAAPLDLIDEVHLLDGSDQRHVPLLERFKKFRTLGSFDLIFDLACTSRSQLLTFFTQAKLKLSFPYKRNLFLYDVCLHRSDFRFEAENLLEFLLYFGHQSSYIQYGLPENKKIGHEVICFFGASNPNRCYPLPQWASLLQNLCVTFPHLVFTILEGHHASENYLELYNQIGHFENLRYQEKLSLNELQDRLSTSFCLISSDTGLRHLAIATHTPTVGFFFNTCPGRNLPTYEDKHLILLDPEGAHPSASVASAAITAHFKQIQEKYS